MNKLTVALDCDLVLAASDLAWWQYIQRMVGIPEAARSKLPHSCGKPLNYDLSSYYEKALKQLQIDAMDFWRSTNTYDWVDPVKGSQEAVKRIKALGDVELIVVSAIKGNHSKSKWNWLQRHFPNTFSGYVATKEKHLVRCDIMIDDRISNLNKQLEGVECILFETPYSQDQQAIRDIKVLPSWDELGQLMSCYTD